jgi:hypothetical protein
LTAGPGLVSQLAVSSPSTEIMKGPVLELDEAEKVQKGG